MKYSSLILVVFLSSFTLMAQVPSSCEAPDSILNQFTDDADFLTIQHSIDQNLTYTDSVNIPGFISEQFLDALIAVYNVEGIPERDSVVTINNIHTFQLGAMRSLLLLANNTEPWMLDLLNGNINTSSVALNNLISTYNLTIGTTNTFGTSAYAELISSTNYNMQVMANEFSTIAGVTDASSNYAIGDGSNIAGSITDDYIELTYSIGWGDCPAGCICHRYWTFRVYDDCSVEFMGSEGCPLTPVGIEEVTIIKPMIYPNPFTEALHFTTGLANTFYSISDVQGRWLLSGKMKNNTIENLENLEPGAYILNLNDGDHNYRYTIIRSN